MSDDRGNPPHHPPGDGPLPPPPGAGEPPTGGSPDDTPVDPSRPPADATRVFPAVPPPPPGGVGAAPPGSTVGGAPYPGGPVSTTPLLRPDPAQPPPRRPVGWIFAIGFVLVAAIVGLLVWALSGDDDGAITSDDENVVRLVVIRIDPAGVPASVDVTATVTAGPAGATPFDWIVPSDPTSRASATRRTDATGRTEFRWAPVDGAILADWSSTVEVREPWPDPTLVTPTASCTLTDAESSIDVAAGVTVEAADPNIAVAPPGVVVERVVAVRFPNVRLGVGDTIECAVSGDAPPPLVPGVSTTTVPDPTTTPDSTTTVPESTTTAPATTTTTTTVPTTTSTTTTTTVPTTTTTTVPTTTTTTTSTTSTTTTTTTTTTSTTTSTTTTTTVPPAPPVTDVLAAEPDLGDFLALVVAAGLDDDLDAPTQPLTVFAPNDAAIAALLAADPTIDPTDRATAEAIVLAHVSAVGRLDAAALAGLTEVVLVDTSTQPVQSTTPLVIGGAGVERVDLDALDAVIHVTDAVFPSGP